MGYTFVGCRLRGDLKMGRRRNKHRATTAGFVVGALVRGLPGAIVGGVLGAVIDGARNRRTCHRCGASVSLGFSGGYSCSCGKKW